DPWAPTEARAETNTAVDGSYRLAVPIAAPVLLIAMPMQEASGRHMRLLRDGGQVADCNVPHDDLLPSCLPVAPRFGVVLEVPGLQLGAPVAVTGRILSVFAVPMADIQVLWRPESGAWSLRLAGRPLEIATDGRVGRS